MFRSMAKQTAAHHHHRTHLETGVIVHMTDDKEKLLEVKCLSPGPPGGRESWDRSPGLSDFLGGLAHTPGCHPAHRGQLTQRGCNRACIPSFPLTERSGQGFVSFDTKNSFTSCPHRGPPRTKSVPATAGQI